jgi:ribose/xylose/arabinose/galactoside ABC-type transport system permease subunit
MSKKHDKHDLLTTKIVIITPILIVLAIAYSKWHRENAFVFAAEIILSVVTVVLAIALEKRIKLCYQFITISSGALMIMYIVMLCITQEFNPYGYSWLLCSFVAMICGLKSIQDIK